MLPLLVQAKTVVHKHSRPGPNVNPGETPIAFSFDLAYNRKRSILDVWAEVVIVRTVTLLVVVRIRDRRALLFFQSLAFAH